MYQNSKCLYTGALSDLSCQMDNYDEDEFDNRKEESLVSEKKNSFCLKKVDAVCHEEFHNK